jgi:hypothetical protein
VRVFRMNAKQTRRMIDRASGDFWQDQISRA